jgi:steroid delta-isomerase-like uncharacterized protein
MSRAATLALLETYYAAFNAGDWEGMLACLSDDVAHDVNQGSRQVGKDTSAAFMGHMERCYKERLEDIVLMASEDGSRAAAEFVVHGTYLPPTKACPKRRARPMCCPPARSSPLPMARSPA